MKKYMERNLLKRLMMEAVGGFKSLCFSLDLQVICSFLISVRVCWAVAMKKAKEHPLSAADVFAFVLLSS